MEDNTLPKTNDDKLFDKRVQRWKEKLLDLTKRNRMLNFRPNKASSLKVEEVFETLPQKLIDDEEPIVYELVAGDKYDEDDPDSITDYLAEARERTKVLRNIMKRVRLSDEEYGYNIGYIAYGFLEWLESDSSSTPLRSPLILIPVTIEQADRFSEFNVNYKHGENVEINPTILEKLKNDFAITIPQLENLDLSDTSNFEKVLEIFVDQIEALPEWKVVREAWLDTFDFQNMVILNDMKVNSQMVQSNMFADSLAESKTIQLDHLQEIDLDSVKAGDKIQILDADSSQEEAIYRASQGESFVIQGPPGTGKSQTITNIIAGALYAGKSILFVSEKQAALDVVYEKLRRADLAVFCLKMHNSRQTKTNIREQLQSSVNLAEQKQQISPDEMQIYDRLDQAKLKLNKYNDNIHKIIKPFGRSAFWVFGHYEKVRSAPEITSKVPIYDYAKTESMFNELRHYVDVFEQTAGDFYNNGWMYYRGTTTEVCIARAKTKAEEILEKVEEYNDLLSSLGENNDSEKLEKLIELVTTYSSSKETRWIDSSWLNLEEKEVTKLKKAFAEIAEKMKNYNTERTKYLANAKIITETRSTLEQEVSGLAEIDLEPYAKMLIKFEKQYRNVFRILKKNYRNDLSELRKIATSPKLRYVKALELLRKINRLEQGLNEEKRLNKLLKKLHEEIVTRLDNPNMEKCAKIKAFANEQAKIRTIEAAFSTESAQDIAKETGFYETVSQLTQEIELDNAVTEDLLDNAKDAAILKLGDRIKELSTNLDGEIEKYTDFVLEQKTKNIFEKILAWQELLQSVDWTAALRYEKYVSIREHILKDYELGKALDEVEESKMPKSDIIPAIQKKLYTSLLEKAEIRNQYVMNFERAIHDRTIMDFREYDNRQLQLAAARIRCALMQKMPDFSGFRSGTYSNSNGEISILKRELKKKSRLMPTRKLLEKIPIILLKLKPCIMMSPITVSSYFSSNPNMEFDLVIFDEASQVKTETAITAIMRAKQLVVAGDSKQMPPTNFFNSSTDDEDEESEELQEVGGLESVLDELAVNLPEVYLKWHYRSRAESLIEFSNKKFYERRLYTFPSVYTNNNDLGLSFKYVESGIWENRGGNRPEAEEVAQLVLKHIKRHPNKSLGIVAFGKSQATAIEDAVLKMRDTFPQYEEFFSVEKDEPFFIKNLENVQGDERDVIILSVGYGKGPDGKFAMRFGPLSIIGGERRLNVAISRAKEQMIVVSSFHATDIRDEEKNENRKLLKDFLDFAEHGNLEMVVGDELDADEGESFDSPFEESVYNFLTNKGYKLKTQVGVSGYKIDMAVVDTKDSGRYILAIECDGAAYHSSRTARDRDRLRQDVLEGMGWKFHRIWSTDWFYNQEFEKQKLLEAVELAMEGKTLTKKIYTTPKHIIKTTRYDADEKVKKELDKLRNSNSLKFRWQGLTINCDDQYLWDKAFEIALDSSFEGKTRDEFARYVASHFLLREKLTSAVKFHTDRAINKLIKDGKIAEVGDSLMKTKR